MIVIADDYGQLGNRLFIFAQFIAFGKENSVNILYPGFSELAQYFTGTRDNPLCAYPRRKPRVQRYMAALVRIGSYLVARSLAFLRIRTRLAAALHVDWLDRLDLRSVYFTSLVKRHRVLFVWGWGFRDVKDLLKHADEIRDFFTPVEQVRTPVDALITNSRKDCDVLIGVHIRRGDYRIHLGGRFFFEIEDYVRLMGQTASLFGGQDVAFLVCSDESVPRSAFDSLPNVTLGTGHFVEDMYAFSRCDYLIGPPSTYTLCASFFGQVPLQMILDARIPITLSDFRVAPALIAKARELY